MRIRKITRSKYRLLGQEVLSNTCHKGSEIAKITGIMTGSVYCSECPLYWFSTFGFVFCHTEKKSVHKETENGTPALRLVKNSGGD